MTLRVVGAGCGRTGATSLKLALGRLLGAPCYHMDEVFEHPEHVPLWHQAALGNEPICNALHLEIPDEPFPRTGTREELRRAAAQAESNSLSPTCGGEG
jgi:hypothetical protein